MAHHKRKRPKHQRSGCLLCKGHKDERSKGSTSNEPVPARRKMQEKYRVIAGEGLSVLVARGDMDDPRDD